MIILPLSVVRWIGFQQVAASGKIHVPPLPTFIVAIIYGLSGVWDAILYLLTRRLIILGEGG